MKTIRYIISFIFLVGCIYLAVWAISPETAPSWTGFGKYDEENLGPRFKTLWDWLDLLIIPIAVGVCAWIFKEAEKDKSNKSEIERNQNETLDSFIKIMTELIINNNLANAKSTLETRIIARTRINLAFSNLSGSRKGQILQFLFESRLIDQTPQINLNGANLKNAILDGIVLSNAEIRGVYFNNATITESNLNGANFISSDFTNANLSKSLMQNTNLSYTNLTNGKMNNMNLTSVNFEGANLTNANLNGSIIRQEQLDQIFKKNGIKISKTKII
jgi:uncharacterized protein YjbI with pentapeptide repeats